MEGLSQLLATQLHFVKAASDFFDACTTFRSIVAARHFSPAPYPSQVTLEDTLAKLQHTIHSITLVESQMHNSRAVLNGLLNTSIARVPINTLPSEILSRIFAIAVSSTPCSLVSGHRDVLLDVPLVCARWHRVAIHTRSLWAHIDVHATPSAGSSIPSFNRLRIFTDRRRGMPIHLHLDTTCNILEKNHITEFISTLQPHVASLDSLTILGGETAPWTRALFTLCSNYGAADKVKTLVILEDRLDSAYLPIALPTCSFQGLVHLELLGPREDARVSLGEFSATISNCPLLHTLLLRNLWLPSEQQNYIHISLPCLRLFQMNNVYGEATPLFLSMLHPGRLELDVRLDVDTYDNNEFTSCVQSLLARSNVVSLTIDAILASSNAQFWSYISAVPCLRALILDVLDQDGPEILGDLLHDLVAQLPNLRSLCFLHGKMRTEDIDRVKEVVQSRNIHTLGFLSCQSPPPSGEQLQNEDVGEDTEDGDHDNLPISHGDMPKSTREWLSERVQRIIIDDIPPARIHQGVGQFIQELI